MLKLKLKDFAKCIRFSCKDGQIIISEQALKDISATNSEVRIGFYSAIMISSGSARIILNGIHYDFVLGQLLFLKPEDVVFFVKISDDAFIRMFAMEGSDFIRTAFLSKDIWGIILMTRKHPIISLSHKARCMFFDTFNLIADIDGLDHQNSYGKKLANNTFMLSFYSIMEDLQTALASYPIDEEYTRAYALFDQFIRLVSTMGGERRQVSQIAEEMLISQKYLSKVVHDSSGATPIEWLNLFTAKAARKRLLECHDPVKSIAIDMGFPTSSSFCTFCKKKLGMTPQEIRSTAISDGWNDNFQ